MKTLARYFILLTTAFALGGGAFWLWIQSETHSIVIESEESQNPKLEPVYNEIKFIRGKDRDVWMMNQSHFGRDLAREKWERLAIVVDKTKTPMTARFYQFKPGPLEWSDNLLQQRTEYRASCFICHNNGPRAIRPMDNSTLAALTWKEKAKIALWNLRVKTYGRIHYDKAHDEEDPTLAVHFRYHGSPHEDQLQVETCRKCHKETGLFARGVLLRQQRGTIEHMIKTNHMPPPGFSLSKQERQQLEDFVHGF